MIKKISFKNRGGRRIVGIINLPKGKPPFPAVIICHGFKGYKEQIILKSLAEVLARAGILALRFDFTNGVGQSFGPLEDIRFKTGISDLRAAVDFLVKQKIVDDNRIGLAGHSLGGQMILYYAPTDRRIKVLADLAGVIQWGNNEIAQEIKVRKNFAAIKKAGYYLVESRGKKRKYKVKLSFIFDMFKINALGRIKKIRVPTLIVHGSKDESVPLCQSRRAYKTLIAPKKLVIIKGAPHTWRAPKFYQQINPEVTAWFKKYL